MDSTTACTPAPACSKFCRATPSSSAALRDSRQPQHAGLNIACADAVPTPAMIPAQDSTASFPDAVDVIRIDGLRVEYPDGFGLARASNTTPVIVLRFEADDAAALARIQGEFRRVLSQAMPGRPLPFCGDRLLDFARRRRRGR